MQQKVAGGVRRGLSPPLIATTWNPSDKDADVSLSGGNLIASAAVGGWNVVRSTTSKNSGQWKFEINPTAAGGGPGPGLESGSESLSVSPPGGVASGIGWDQASGDVASGGVVIAAGGADSYTTGNILSFEIDFDKGLFWLQKNGGTGRKGPFAMPTARPLFIAIGCGGGSGGTLIVAAGSFTIAANPGFYAWGDYA